MMEFGKMNELLRKHILRGTFVLAIIVCCLWYYFDHNWHPFINVFAFALGYFATVEGKSADLAGIWSYKVIRSGKNLGMPGDAN